MRPILIAMLSTSLGACAPNVDPRFATPEATVRTLLDSYGLAEVSESEVRGRLGAHASFSLRDRETFQRCFSDLRDPRDEGLAGYVLGAIAAAKDSLVVDVDEDTGHGTIRLGSRGSPTTIVVRRNDGAWRIVLAESVPERVRRQLHAIHRRAMGRLRLGS
jgi:hypothetical protein